MVHHHDWVIIGGGAGGLELAAKLGRKFGRRSGPDKVLLADRSLVHIWKPSLHEVAVGTLNPQQEGLLYPNAARHNHFSFRLGALTALDPQARTLKLAAVCDEQGTVLVPETTVSFKYCVLSIGSGTNSFGTKGFEHAFVLESVADAQAFHRHLFSRFLQTAYADNRQLNIAIVGGGATGVELAAEMTEAHREICQITGSVRHFNLNINLIESSPRILAALSEDMSAHAADILQRKHIRIHCGTRVSEITPQTVITSDGREFPADITVWAAGIKAAESNRTFGLETNALNQFTVNDTLETSAPGIYALGDCAALENNGQRVPATAQAAHQQAAYLAKRFWALEQQRPFTESFSYNDSGSLVALGRKQGAGSLIHAQAGKSLFIQGLLAKYAHMSLHLMHYFTVLGLPKTILLALARLTQRRIDRRLKLH